MLMINTPLALHATPTASFIIAQGIALGTGKRMPLITLRPAQPDDEEFLFAVYASTRRDEVAAWGWGAAQQDAFLRMQFTAQQGSYQMQGAEVEQSIVLQDERPVGRLIVIRTGAEICLADIALLPEYRNAGIGSALIGGLLDEARSAGQPVRLHVLKNNRAQRLYERLGFVSIGDDGLHLSMEYCPA